MSANPFPADMQGPPKGLLEKLGAALPVALTAIATAFAGLSTSEMSRAMYYRSAAAQDQAKANDQWSLAAHKRDRAIMMQTAATQLRSSADFQHAIPGAVDALFAPNDPVQSAAKQWLLGNGPPAPKSPEIEDPAIRGVLESIREGKPESDVVRAAREVDRDKLEAAVDRSLGESKRLDVEWQPVVDFLAQRFANWDRAHKALQFEVDERRYRIEAGINQRLGHLYEVRVRTSTVQAERHRVRSDYFFYALLVAQAGAALGAMALARRHRSVLWLMAGVVGLVAVGFGAYVYLNM